MAEGREHFFKNKVEAGAQLVCAILYFIGLLLVSMEAHDSAYFKGQGEAAPQFTFSVGMLMILALLYNAGAHIPEVTPLLIALGFYFFNNAINMVDGWVQFKDIVSTSQLDAMFDNYDQLLAGGCICLLSASVALMFEMSVPARTGRDGAMGAPEVTAILFSVIACIGLFVVWSKNDAETNPDYTTITGLSLKCLICIGLLADAVLHFDIYVSHAAVVLGTVTGCEMWFVGLRATIDGLNDDQKTSYRGCLVCAFGMCALIIAEVVISVSGRNKNDNPRPKIFSSDGGGGASSATPAVPAEGGDKA